MITGISGNRAPPVIKCLYICSKFSFSLLGFESSAKRVKQSQLPCPLLAGVLVGVQCFNCKCSAYVPHVK